MMDQEYRTAFVYVRDSFAGTLRETDEGYVFQYDAKYLSDLEAPAVSLTLPRQEAPFLSKTLFASLQWAKEEGASVQGVQQRVIDTINAIEGLEVEYYEIVDQTTLLPTDTFDHAIGCVTVYCGPVRLIDNIKYNL